MDSRMEDLLSSLKTKKSIPDLFLIDYYLDQRTEQITNERFGARGLSVAARIREILPEHPIYGVTNFSAKKDGIFASEAQAASMLFDNLLSYKEIQRFGQNILYLDALDYALIKNSKRNSFDILISLLNSPDCAHEIIHGILPDDLRKGISSVKSGNSISFANWVRNVLLDKPGILYNDIYSATYLGMDLRYFAKIKYRLKSASYNGVFSKTNSQTYWWRCELNHILFSTKIAVSSNKANPWEIAPLVFKTPNNHLSKCVVCNLPYPETIGTNVKDDSEVAPVHFKCSKPHPFKKRELYFDEFRVFEP